MQVEETPNIPEDLRDAYLGSLPESQELYVENLVSTATKVLVRDGRNVIAYAAVHDATIVEFFVVESALNLLSQAFDAVVTKCGVRRALCKTFDSRMLTAAASKPAGTRTVGFLFRKLVDRGFVGELDVVARLGSARDIDAVLSIHDGFFDGLDEVEGYIRDGGLFLYETKDGPLLGCGIVKRIVPSRAFFDVGMVVAPAHRGRRLGAHIVAHLTTYCLDAGYRPVCGCDANNVASRRTLERAGFVTAHSLVEFTYGGE